MLARELITAEMLGQLPGGSGFELVGGRLVRVNPANPHHARLAALISARLLTFVEPRRIGTVMVEAGFTLSRNPDTVRGPDVSFVRAGRADFPPRHGFAQGAPDLAVEVVSPDNTIPQLLAKATEYFGAGAELVWIVDPDGATVRVLGPGIEPVVLGIRDALDGGTTLPGFTLSLAELFATDA
jgi:Uma2 family endonuclease